MALGEFRTALFEKGRFDPDVFQSWKNFFAVRNIPSRELEAQGATPLIGQGVVPGWAAASLYGRAPETQVDIPRFSAQIASVAARLTRLGFCGRPRGLCASTDRATLPGDGTLSLARVATEGEVLDVLAQSKRNKHAALKLMRKLLKKYSLVPRTADTHEQSDPFVSATSSARRRARPTRRLSTVRSQLALMCARRLRRLSGSGHSGAAAIGAPCRRTLRTPASVRPK